MKTLTVAKTIDETQPATYGTKPGERDTYYAVHLYRFDDDDPNGWLETADTLSELSAIVAGERRRALAKSRRNDWPDAEAFQVGRVTRYNVRYI